MSWRQSLGSFLLGAFSILLVPSGPAFAAPGRAGYANPISVALRTALRDARRGCRWRKEAAACARMKQLYAERKRILEAHRDSLRKRGLLPPRRSASVRSATR
jgi:hypothetical protein